MLTIVQPHVIIHAHMGERHCGERSARYGESMALPALHQMGPMPGIYLQDEIEGIRLAAELSETLNVFGR